ncbi:4-hydroxybenzoate octaprenyltransferase [Algihabitans albus]|uniref:4-hydroxybenzoate octaprenyltransferase n=1 Tax=Algihabitans albus TaxID=2164067 RepID=UPI000E5D528E|nr:4-hydroxybenzoate octaprenyltransferase [Algihabitans albus]
MAGSQQTTAKRSDIPRDSWVDRHAPEAWRPYLRLARADRPIGTWLLLWPCWWSIALATAWQDQALDLPLLLLFGLGALVMRAAGCTVNDLLDRRIDAKVARTASRPIASGQISVLQALVFLAVLLGLGLAILLQLSQTAILLGLASLLLVFPYPLMKRITYWPQAWLGLTFNWGALMGWAAVTGSIAWPALLLYVAGFFWTLGYDTIYAHQDKEDDALIGVRSSALRLGNESRPWLAGFYAVAVLLLIVAGWSAEAAWPYFLGVAAMAGHFVWQIVTLDIDDPRNCLVRFKSNRDAGALFLAGILLAGPL